MKKIKFTLVAPVSLISNMFYSELDFPKNWEYTPRHEDADFIICMNENFEGNLNGKKIILVQVEPPWSNFNRLSNYGDISRFDKIYQIGTAKSADNADIDFIGSSLFPRINSNMKSEELVKRKKMSIVTSSLHCDFEDPVRNYGFRHAVVDWILSTNMNIDIFGCGIEQGRTEFDSRLHSFIPQKEVGICPYQYSIAIENSDYPNYQSEKITELLLTETIPIYCGSDEVFNLYETPIKINKKNFKEVITDVYENATYNREAVKRDKKLYKTKYNVFSMIERDYGI